jgi:hypothetical protein
LYGDPHSASTTFLEGDWYYVTLDWMISIAG